MRRLFGTDGVRGIVGQNMNPNFAFRLAFAAGQMMRASNHRGAVLVGRDTRDSGEMLEKEVAKGFAASGMDVWLAGVMTTPGVAFLTTAMGEAAGVVISASHNPYHYNGIKLFSPAGCKFPDEEEDEISRIFYSLADSPSLRACGRGRILPMNKAVERYISYLVSPYEDALKGVKLALDCANGAAYEIAPQVFRAAGAEVTSIGVNPDGRNINTGCGALHTGGLQRLVVEGNASAGLALDGDADRAILVDENGNQVDGDHVLAMMARDLKANGRLPKNLVVGTTMSNLGLTISLREAGCQLLRAKVGDRYVLEMMQKEGANLGGEPSGHIIFLDRANTGDGLLTGLAALSLMNKKGQPLSELASVMHHLPQVMINLPLRDNRAWQKDPEIKALIQEIADELDDNGRVVVRPSGTEQLVRIMVEGLDQERVTRAAQRIATEFTNRYGT
ncbi:MAG: phosphoglucosamine mutase [Armatimonadetes bacterium]|nr:phosphoglucosamine mutase [Armatimonadota bacterium]NIO75531.1 phosphoglucosamine mutase [Armatimonadota bacterium]NIO95908.1 phosphoglucosamine mutase [Armatimonadota bacterium]